MADPGFVVSSFVGRQHGNQCSSFFCERRMTRKVHVVRRSYDDSRFRNGLVLASISSNELRPGSTIELNGNLHRVLESMHVKPGKGSAFVRTKLKNMKTGHNVDRTFRAGESLTDAMLEKVHLQHTYVDKQDLVFMNMESFEEERISEKTLGKRAKFIKVGSDVTVLKHNDQVIGVELPKTMTFEVVECEPGAKGNTAQGSGSKPGVLETGLEVSLPLFVQKGEQVIVNTDDGKYAGRGKK